MPKASQQNVAVQDMQPYLSKSYSKKAMAEVQILDPELLTHPTTLQLVEQGIQIGKEITSRYGEPSEPKWAFGAYETNVFMSYHNGGEDGHTSVGPKGCGVPRNALIIAKAVNKAANREVYNPLMRATVFYAAQAHDSHQLCGRALLPEGQANGRGDERLSAEDAKNRYLKAGGNAKIAQNVYNNIMATAFNPKTSTQNVNYSDWRNNPNDPNITLDILEQELTATADLFGAISQRSPLNSIEYSIESLCLNQNNQIIQKQLRAFNVDSASITTTKYMLNIIAQNDILLNLFTDTLANNAIFVSSLLKYSDVAIRAACGKGIDELFLGRMQKAAIIARYAEKLRSGAHPITIWEHARKLAGYKY